MAVPDSVRLKLTRAEQHLYELSGDIGAYLDGSLNKIVLNVQPNDQRLVLVEYHVIAEPDRRLGVIIGDCVHNLRSALDHLACCLVEKNGGTATEQTQFPISNKRPRDKGEKPSPRIAGGVTDNVLRIVDALQPYQRGQDAALHPLSVLRTLSNADKHRLLHTAAAQSTGNSCVLRDVHGNVIAATFVPGGS